MIRKLCLSIILIAAGCSGRPGRIKPADIDPDAAAAAALEQLDKNSDSTLNEGELAAAPGLASARERYDSDHSGTLSAAEIAAGIRRWSAGNQGALNVPFVVLWNGRTLDGVQVKLTPEPFLGEEAK